MKNIFLPFLKITLLIWLVVFTNFIGAAQEDTTQYPINLVDLSHAEERTNTDLSFLQKMLQVKMYLVPKELDRFKEKCVLLDSQSENYDCTTITLHSGLSWNLEKGPPEKPKHFNWYIFSKKGRNRPEMQERIKYLQFVYRCEEINHLATDMIERLDAYYSFTDHDGNLCLRAIYRFQPNEKGGYDLVKTKVKEY